MPQICGVVMAEEPGTAAWSVVSGPTTETDRRAVAHGTTEGGDCWSCSGWRQQDSLGLRQ
eukprot:2949937-Rhodomonas_salina.1